MAQRPDLKEEHSVAPHVTGTGVLPVLQSLDRERWGGGGGRGGGREEGERER